MLKGQYINEHGVHLEVFYEGLKNALTVKLLDCVQFIMPDVGVYLLFLMLL